MEIGVVGLGKMGLSLALNMLDKGHSVKAYDSLPEKIQEATENKITAVSSLDELVENLKPQRVIWLMIPAGKPVDDVIEKLISLLDQGDIIIDGGNSFYKDTLRRYELVKSNGINFVDIGTSGGISGARNGACTMVGADMAIFQIIEPLLRDICVLNGFIHAGGIGSGHFVKMVHNGIEYGMMQAMAEGFEILQQSGFNLNLQQIARVWNNGSVIRSWLMELIENALSKDPRLDSIRGVMHSSGEGLWTVQTALELKVPAPVITDSLLMRFRSLQEESFAGKVVAALRQEFGGHVVEKTGKGPA